MSALQQVMFGSGVATNVLSFVVSGTTTLSTISIPATAAIGDLAVLVDVCQTTGGAPVTVVPAGFTQQDNLTGSTGRIIVSTKILIAGDPGASLTGMSSTTNRKSILIFRPSNFIIATVTVGSINGEVNSSIDPAAQVVTASAGTTPLVVLGTYYANATITGNTFTPSADATVSSGTNNKVSYKVYNANPADTTVDMGSLGSLNMLESLYLAVS